MWVVDIFRIGQFRREIAAAAAELAALKSRLSDAAVLTDVELRERAVALEAKNAGLATEIEDALARLAEVSAEAAARQAQIVQLDDTILLQEFALYKPKYGLTNSAAYKDRIEACVISKRRVCATRLLLHVQRTGHLMATKRKDGA